MIERRQRNKGLTYRVKRLEGRLTATFENREAAELQDALWGRWGTRIPVLVDKRPEIPLTLRTRLLDRETSDLSEQLLADLLSRHPAASHVLESEAPTVGEYIVETFFPMWKKGLVPGSREGVKSAGAIREMKRGLNNIVFDAVFQLDAKGNRVHDEHGPIVLGWGDNAWAWTPMDQVTAQTVMQLDQLVKERGIGREVWRKTRNFLEQMFRNARLDANSGFPIDRANPVSDVPPPKQKKVVKRRAYLPETAELIRADFFYLASLAAADVRRVRGGPRIDTPGGVPVPPSVEEALQWADMVEGLAYSGWRPGELLGAMGRGFDPSKPNYFLVNQRNVNGTIVPGTKSLNYDWKDVLLLGPLPRTIGEKAAVSGHDGLLYPDIGTGKAWMETKYRNWRRRYFEPIARARGLGPESDDPYALRHVYSSVRIAAGHPKAYIDASLGSSLSDSVYRTIYSDLEQRGLAGSYDIDAAIADARAAAVEDLRERLQSAGLDPAPALPL